MKGRADYAQQVQGIDVPAGLRPGRLDLTTVDGNAFAVIGAVARALRRQGNTQEVVDQFRRDAMSGDYDHVLACAMAYTIHDTEEQW